MTYEKLSMDYDVKNKILESESKKVVDRKEFKMSGSNFWNKNDVVFLFICAIFLYLHLFILNTPIFWEEDHLYFIQDAWRMYRGEALYKDFFEYTFPGTQVLYLCFLYLFGTKFWIINAVIFLQGFSQTIITLVISKRIFGNRWISYLSSSIFLFFGFRWFGVDGSHRMLSPIFIGLAILVLLKNRSRQRIFLSGVFCALASYFTQQRGVIVISAIALFLIFEAFKNQTGIRKIVIDIGVLGVSFSVVLLILLLPFIISAGAETFFEYTIVYIKYYVQEPTANYGAYSLLFQRTWEQGISISLVMLFYYCLIPLVYFIAFFFLWRKKYQSEIFLITLVGCFLALGTFAPTPLRLYQICIPAIIVFVWLISLTKLKSESFIRTVVILLIAFGCFLAVRIQTTGEKVYLDTPTGRVVFLSAVKSERYKWLLENAIEGEYVFEVYQTAVNFPLQLPNPTQITFLLDNGYTPEWMVNLAVENLKEKKPRLIIWDGVFNKEKSERKPGDHLAPLYDYLRENYTVRQNFTPYVDREMQIWERK